MTLQPGLRLVHKPVGETSFGLVKAARQEPSGRPLKVCHAGVLDPFAEGLVVLLVGGATRLMELFHPLPKRYLATVRWGVETDNGDPTGRSLAEGDASGLTPERLDAALTPLLGWTDQVPPLHSNKRIAGERAWQKAHRGEAFELPPSRVYLHSARWRSHALPESSVLELTCRGGYYVRALARDLGRALGCRAHLSALARTGIGPFEDPGPGQTVALRGPALLPWCESRAVDDHELGVLRAGQPIPTGPVHRPRWPLPQGFPDPEPPIAGVHQDRLVALLRADAGGLAASALFGRGL